MKGDPIPLPGWTGQDRRPEASRTQGAGGPVCVRSIGAAQGFTRGVLVLLLIAGLAILSPTSARADTLDEAGAVHHSTTFVSLTVDNDFFAGFDRHYTNGVQLAFSADARKLPESLQLLPPLRWSAEPRFTFSVGQRIYTPADKERADPDPLDRPYAGWLYALAEVRTRTGPTVDHVQASVGIIGPASLAEQTQNSYHSLIGAERARGWDAQLDNEPALLIGYERAWPALVRASLKAVDADFTPRAGVTAGNVFTYASSGIVARLGSNLPDDFPATYVSLGPPRDGYHTTGTRFGWYTWFGAEARLVAWNTFVEGNAFGDGPGVEREPLVYDLQLGIVAVWRKSRIGFTFVRRSEEFETQQGADKFGQLTATFPMGS